MHEENVDSFYSSGLDKVDPDDVWPLTYGYWLNENDTYNDAAKQMWDRLYGSANIVPGESIVVVVAPGMGLELLHLYRTYLPRKIYGVDITEEHVKRTRNLIEKEGLSDFIELIHGSGTRLNEYINDKVTHVLCVEGTIQMDNRHGFYQSARNILVDGGVFGFCDSCVKHYPSGMADGLFKNLISSMWLVPVENMQTPADMIADLESLNYKIQLSETFGDRVWIPYCNAKLKEFSNDVTKRGMLNAIGLFAINETLRFGCYFTDNIDYCVIIAVK